MKSARTARCKLCMQERKEILHRINTDKTKIMNDNSDIFSSCKCGGNFHKFTQIVHTKQTLRTRSTQKKVSTSTKNKQPKRARRTKEPPTTPQLLDPLATPYLCQPCSAETVASNPASPPPVTSVFLFDTNVPGLPYRSPTARPTNLELAQVAHYVDTMPPIDA